MKCFITNEDLGVEATIEQIGSHFRLSVRDTDAERTLGIRIDYPTFERAERAAYAAVDLPLYITPD